MINEMTYHLSIKKGGINKKIIFYIKRNKKKLRIKNFSLFLVFKSFKKKIEFLNF
jgi:hypothetical protein